MKTVAVSGRHCITFRNNHPVSRFTTWGNLDQSNRFAGKVVQWRPETATHENRSYPDGIGGAFERPSYFTLTFTVTVLVP